MSPYTSNYIASNGIQIHYHRATPPGGAPALVLLHGLTDNGMCWVRVADELRGQYDVIMPDARGHGFSDKPTSGYGLEDRAADVAGLIDALGLERPVLLGHSMGGQTATAVAALYPDKVRAIVLEDPSWLESNDSDEDRSQQANQWLTGLLHSQSLSLEALIQEGQRDNPGWHVDELGPWADSKHQMGGEALVQILNSMRPGWRDLVRQAQCPILLVTPEPGHGILTPAMVQECMGLWHQGREANIPGAGHCIHRDRMEAYMPVVRAFLDEVFADH